MTCLRNDGKHPVVIGGLVVPSGAVIEIDEGQAVFVREKLPLLTEVSFEYVHLKVLEPALTGTVICVQS